MKKLFFLFAIATALIVQGCEGPPGPQGEPGYIFLSSAFEISGINFSESNDFSVIQPYGFTAEPYDMTLVYLLWESPEGKDIWRLLPQQIYFEQGILSYNYDFTDEDVRIFMEILMTPEDFADVDFEGNWSQDQVFRIVVLPGENIDARLDFTDYEATMDYFGIEEEDFQKRSK